MHTLFLDIWGVSLRVQGSKLIIEDKPHHRTVEEISPDSNPYTMVVINGMGGCISFEALRFLIANGKCPIVWLTWTGRPLAVTLPMENETHGMLRLNQYKAHLNPEARLFIARQFILSKIRASNNLLKGLGLSEISMKREHQALEAKDLRSLIVCEARSASEFYRSLKTYYDSTSKHLKFYGRTENYTQRHMSVKDEIGSMQNYAFGILEGICQTAVSYVGLESGVGFVHNTKPAGTPLVQDFKELGRWLADLAVMRCVIINNLTSKDFYRLDNYAVYLTIATAKKLVKCMDEVFSLKVKYKQGNSINPEGSQAWAYSNIIRDKAQNLANYLVGLKDLDLGMPALSNEALAGFLPSSCLVRCR